MNAKQLFSADGTPCTVWQCGKCARFYGEKEAYSSEWCCTCRTCGAEIGDAKWECDKCWISNTSKRNMERLESATELVGYAGPVVSGIDAFYPSVEEYADMCDSGLGDLPEFVHTCTIHHYHISLDDVIQDLHKEASLEDEQELSGVEELRAAVDKFNKANEDKEYWRENSKHKVRVPKREEEP